MGTCCSVPEEARRGPIRTRFDLDHAPEDAPKSVYHVAVPPDAPTKNPDETPEKKRFRFPLIGHKNVLERNITLNSFFPTPTKSNLTTAEGDHEKSHHLTIMSDIYEYLPQIPLHLVGLTYHARHPTLRDTLYFLSYRNNPLTHKRRWTKETYGTTWPTVVRSSAVHTYDPVLKHNVKTIKVTDILIYDAKDYIQGAVYVVIRDTEGNTHAIIPYYAPTIDGHQYGVRLDIKQDKYLDEIDFLLGAMRRRLMKSSEPAPEAPDAPQAPEALTASAAPASSAESNLLDVFGEQTVAKTTAEEAIERAVANITATDETTSEEIEKTEGAVGDEVGDGVETDDEEGIVEEDVSTTTSLQGGRPGQVSDTIRIMEEIMGGDE